MTVLRRDPGASSNYFDAVLSGIGHRGSSFTDIDALTHDGETGRVLVQEFKGEGERVSDGQMRALQHLASLPRVTVWVVARRRDGRIGWCDIRWPSAIDVLSIEAYQSRFRLWWAGGAKEPAPMADLSEALQRWLNLRGIKASLEPAGGRAESL